MLDLPFQDIKEARDKILDKRRHLGLAYKTERRFEIDPRQKDPEYLDTLIHEGLHVICPQWEEEYVIHVANELSKLIWKRGYRRRKPKNDTKKDTKKATKD